MDIEIDHSNEAIASMIDHPNVILVSKSERKVLALITPHIIPCVIYNLTILFDLHSINTMCVPCNLFDLDTSKVTAPQDAHRRLVLPVYLGSNTLEFSAIHR